MGFGNINRAMGLCLMMWVAWIAPGLSVCPTWHLTDGKYEAVYRHYLKECLRQEGAGNPDGPGKNEGSGVETTPKVNPPVRPTVPTSGQNKVPSETAPNAKLSSEPPRIKQVNALRVATPRSAQPIQAVKSTTLESQTGGKTEDGHRSAFFLRADEMLNPYVVMSFRAIRARSAPEAEPSASYRIALTRTDRTAERPSFI
ncbi:N8.1gamma [macacine gammaherpesvirus 12]|uniref:N8.1gamma n=1 Tax=macacine gammaherpesvirus 12 TaxID=2560571 RepID=A0A0B5D5G3_9GAMA|nr:N8.1gamma [Macaca nemestrina rhadinovirus 2]AJE29697.1 N8.1gamma [Macaca nemestrina rhadinovirus 2]